MTPVTTDQTDPPAISQPDPPTIMPESANSLPQSVAPLAVSTDTAASTKSWIRAFFGLTAASWYLSLSFHLLAYGTSAALFWWLGSQLLPVQDESRIPPLRASLDDIDNPDETPALQIIQSLGPNRDSATSSLQQYASHLEVTEDGLIETVVSDARIAVAGSEEADAQASGDNFFFRIPESGLAVTKGSFTAWTDPERPAPGEHYQIIIEMRLPEKVRRYRTSDLSGVVIGTDGYRQRLPFEPKSPAATRITAGGEPEVVTSRSAIDIEDRKIQLVIKVPGAQMLVKDTIRIRSRRLKEKQELVIIFGLGESEDNETGTVDEE